MHERHGASKTRLYKIWCAMRERCYRVTNDGYPIYGGRGITVCDEWRESFSAFQRWALGEGYRSDKSIDRIDNDGSYHPDNCRWATDKMQARNRGVAKSHIMVEHDGLMINLSELARKTKIGYTTLRRRHLKGLRGTALIAQSKTKFPDPFRQVRRETGNGNAKLTDAQVMQIRESIYTGVILAKIFNVAESTISMIRAGTRRAST